MSHDHRLVSRAWIAGIALIVAGLSAPSASAQTPAKPDVSARLVPANAPFYNAWLRNREQFDIFTGSRAFAALKNLPAVQQGMQAAQLFLGQLGAFDQFEKFKQDPENAALLDMLAEAVSDEIFCTGGESAVDLLSLLGQLNTNRFGPMLGALKGQNFGADPNQLQAQAMLKTLLDHRNQIKAPDLVIGFKIKNVQRAEAQIKRLETMLAALAAQAPQLEGKVKRVALAGSSFLTLILDGSMVPWDAIPFDLFAENQGQFDPLVDKLKSLKLTVSIGVRDGYLLVAMGESTAAVTMLGTTGQRLIDAPEFRPLAKHAAARLTSIGYSSKSYRARVRSGGADIEEMLGAIRDNVPADILPEKLRKKLDKQLRDLAKKGKAADPGVGAELSFTFLTATGYESFAYDWSRHDDDDASQPLTILNHIGGNPILAAVGRNKSDPEGYREFVAAMKTVGEFIDEWIGSQPDDKKQEFTRWNKALRPLLARLDKVTGTMLIPALADGQGALVLDAKWASKQWHQALPVADPALPMLELGIVVGVSDAPLLEKAVAGYGSVIEDAVAKIGELVPDSGVPAFKFPKPQTRTTAQGKVFTWPVPEELGLDAQFAPTAGLASKVAVVTLSARHAERLLKSTPIASESKLLTKSAAKPLAGAVHFNWPGLVDLAAPWVEFGANAVARDKLGAEVPADIMRQVHTVMEVLKCYRGSGSIRYLENGAMVTHGESIYRDLPKR
jgi:hypothetical protein